MRLWQAVRSRLSVKASATCSKRGAAMQRIQWVLGVATTTAVAAVWWNGGLDKFERDSIDIRAKNFPSANAHPSDRIVVVAIDDPAIENIGRWPWDREKLAAVIDELTNAGVSVVALDLLLDDPQRPRPVQGAAPGQIDFVHDDDALAAAIKRHGHVISATAFSFTKSEAATNIVHASLPSLYDVLSKHPELGGKPFEEVSERLRPLLPGFEDLRVAKGNEFEKLKLRWDAANTLLSHAPDSSVPVPAVSVPWAVSIEPGVPIRQIAAASSRIANVTFDSYDPDGLTRRIPLVIQHNGRLWPTLGLAAALEYYRARATGVTAQTNLTVTPDAVRIDTADGDARTLTSFTEHLKSGNVAGLHLVSWPRALRGGDIPVTDWQRQFFDERATTPYVAKPGDTFKTIAEQELSSAKRAPAVREVNPGLEDATLKPGTIVQVPGRRGEEPIGRVYEPAHLARAIDDNIAELSSVADFLLKERLWSGKRLEAWQKARADLSANAIGSPAWRGALDALKPLFKAADGDLKLLSEQAQDALTSSGLSPELKEQTQLQIRAYKRASEAPPAAFAAIEDGVASITRLRKELKERLSGTICFVGWTATGSLADFVATSIHPRTPGVHVHAAVCNSVLTGFQRTQGPMGGQLLVLIALGMVGTWIGVRSSVVGGPLLVLGALALWTAFACIVLWGMYDSVWSIAGPIAAASSGWLVVVLHRLLVEQRSRRKTEERFKSYVSPAVVDILVENPSLSSMAPQQKELTVLFTDIAGFTTTAEKLGSQGTAELLAVYLGTMTEIVQRHRATLDKYIGDAIMAFWGAPIDDAQHARHACTAAVEMMNTLDRLNADGSFGPAGTLNVRIGLATGDLMVGDFGNPPRNSSYTVIGDTANLSSRLEGANKVFGTRTLVSDLTRLQAGEGFLWRRIGMIRVKGKHTGIWVYELLPGPIKGDKTADWVALCESLIADYQAERFEQALQKAVQLRTEYHDEGFASAYGEAIATHQAGLAEDAFDGCITLTDK